MIEPMADFTRGEINQQAIDARLKADKRKRDTAIGAEVTGLLILAIGLAMVRPWLGIAIFGLGTVLLGVGLELS